MGGPIERAFYCVDADVGVAEFQETVGGGEPGPYSWELHHGGVPALQLQRMVGLPLIHPDNEERGRWQELLAAVFVFGDRGAGDGGGGVLLEENEGV